MASINLTKMSKDLEIYCSHKGWFAIGPIAMQKFVHSRFNSVEEIVNPSLLAIANGNRLTIQDNIKPGTIGVYIIRHFNLTIIFNKRKILRI